MTRNRLGCFSASAIIALTITLLIVGAVAVSRGSAMFSPGELSAYGSDEVLGSVTSHANTGDNCAACHVAPWSAERMSDRCQTCHNEIKLDVTDVTSLHGALLLHNPELTCRDCHPDHRGADAPLTEMIPATFPHERVGFSLASHQTRADGSPFICTDCHTQSITFFEESICSECHQQIDSAFVQAHALNFGNDCRACHDGLESYTANFDHSKTNFALTGQHTRAICAACHLNARSAQDFKNTSSACSACHLANDAHNGNFGTDCSICHSAEGWEPATFDHDLTAFKLEGEHREVACEKCHVNNIYQGTSTDCFSCHEQDDEHHGQYGTDCSLCHTAQGWKPATFDHALVSANCATCHLSDDAHNGRYGTDCSLCHTTKGWEPATFDHALVSTNCATCHLPDDAHNGLYGTDCAICHSTKAWEPASFDHNLSNFPLTGAHVSTACESCHRNGSFSGLSTECVSCHADPAYHLGAFGTDCAACHTTSAWSPAEFNMKHTFPLNHGENGTSPCATCHPSSFTSYTCYNCHEHSEAEVRSKHLEEGIANFQNCMECHADGREHDD